MRIIKNYPTVSFSIIAMVVLIALLLAAPIITAQSPKNESAYSESLNIHVNESGTYNWTVKNPGDIKSLKVSGAVNPNGAAKVYVEKNGQRYLLFDSSKQLFDVNIHVLPDYKKISPGDEILIEITLLNLRGFGSGNISVDYAVKDTRSNLIASQKESIYVETQAKFVRKLIIPAEIKSGTYVAFVEAKSGGNIVGTGSDAFEVKGKVENKYPTELKYYLIGLAGFVGFIIILVLANYVYRAWRKKKEIANMKEKLPLEMTKKLEEELNALDTGRSSGFISEESYQKQKKRIEEKLDSLRR